MLVAYKSTFLVDIEVFLLTEDIGFFKYKHIFTTTLS